MTTGLIALAAALIVATALGLVLRRRSGQFRSVGPGQVPADQARDQTREPAGPARTTPVRPVPGDSTPVPSVPGPAPAPAPAAPAPAVEPDVLTGADLGGALGARATLVQFSTAFCAPCRPTRLLLAQVAGMVDGVTHIDVDAAERMDLVRRLKVNSTPTVLVLGPDGAIAKRAVGLPRKADVIAALGTVIGPAAADLHATGAPASRE
jgi:thiol-disulfide isomerase/thioredoxin